MKKLSIDAVRAAFRNRLHAEVEIGGKVFIIEDVGRPYCAPHGTLHDSVPQFEITLANDRRSNKDVILILFTFGEGIEAFERSEGSSCPRPATKAVVDFINRMSQPDILKLATSIKLGMLGITIKVIRPDLVAECEGAPEWLIDTIADACGDVVLTLRVEEFDPENKKEGVWIEAKTANSKVIWADRYDTSDAFITLHELLPLMPTDEYAESIMAISKAITEREEKSKDWDAHVAINAENEARCRSRAFDKKGESPYWV